LFRTSLSRQRSLSVPTPVLMMAPMVNTQAPEYPFDLQVKNTFLHSPMGHHLYMEGDATLRRVASAPSLCRGSADDVSDAMEHDCAEVMLANADAGNRLGLAKPPPSVLVFTNALTPKPVGEGDTEASSVDECTDIYGHNSGNADEASPCCGPPVSSPSSSTSASGGSFRSSSPTPRDSFASEAFFPNASVPEVEQKGSPPILRLAEVLLALDEPVLEPVLEMPSLGSSGHMLGHCRPCMFFWRNVGCHNGAACSFCHLSHPGDVGKQRNNDETENERNNFFCYS